MSPPCIKLSAPATREFWEIAVLHEDQHLLALDKPSLLLTSPDRYDPERPNLMKLLHHGIERAAPWAKARQLDYLMNAHRLDFETSGVILLAKNKPALTALVNLFGSEKPSKLYTALVQGQPADDQFEANKPIAPHPFKPGRMCLDPKRGKRSRTLFRVLDRFAGYTLLECQPLTGRTHQIRVHLRGLGLSIVGDEVYGGGPLLLSRLKPNYRCKPGQPERPLIGWAALHALRLTLAHPVTGDPLSIEAPLPKDFRVALKYLKRFASASTSLPP
jgi:RluA family pseudouridine synthase